MVLAHLIALLIDRANLCRKAKAYLPGLPFEKLGRWIFEPIKSCPIWDQLLLQCLEPLRMCKVSCTYHIDPFDIGPLIERL